jgi:hypothetical protein
MSCRRGIFAPEEKRKQPLFEKSGAKTFLNWAVPVIAAQVKITKYFCYFLFTKSSSLLAFCRHSF